MTGQAADEAAVDAVLTASRTLVAVATRSLGAAAEKTTIAQYRALVVLASRGPQRMAGLTEGLLACAFAAAGVAAARQAVPGKPGSGSQDTAVRLAAWRQCAADRVAAVAVPRAVRRWAVWGGER